MMQVWVQVNYSEPMKISIEGSKDLDDFCYAIEEAIPEFSKVGLNDIVIKSHEDMKLARKLLMSNCQHLRHHFICSISLFVHLNYMQK